MKKSIVIVVTSVFVCMQSAFSQITTNELPVSVQRGLGLVTKDKTIGTVDLPAPDIKKLLQEDSLNLEGNPTGFQRTAVSIPVIIDVNKDGVWSTLEDGGRLWQMEIYAEKALALDFVFSKFWLPKEGKFFLFNPTTKEAIGAITSKYILGDKNKPHRFSTGILKGDKIILEYYQPAEEEEFPIIKVEKAYYTYIPAPNFLSSSTCSYEVNVNCSEGSNWQLEKNAVALVYCKNGYIGEWGSGSLVNNTQNNLFPLFLTANHCVSPKDAIDDNDLSDYIFYWGYELENCSSTTQPNYYTTVGATLIANNSYSDFALLQLLQDPINIPGYIPYYLGWDASGSSGTGGVCIHHPNHDVKKISTYSCTPTTVSYDSSPAVYWAVSWIATANGHGITETASSGSPLINNSHRVIGQLKGASATLNCSNLTGGTSKYGKLSASWTGNGNYDYRRRLNCWLNPSGTNVQSIDGLSPYSISGPSYIIQSTQSGTYSINNLPSIYTVEWSLSDSYYNQYHMQQNSPSQNQCTITRDNLYDLMNGTLTAVIKYNGDTIQTLTKTGLYAYNGFRGEYTSGNLSGNIDYTQLFYVRPNVNTYVYSPSLVGATASYDNTTTIPNNWGFSSQYGYLQFIMPSNNNGIPVVIYITDAIGGNYQLYAVPQNYKSLNISSDENSITITLNENGDSERGLILDQTWTVEIRNATTGALVATQSSASRSTTIATSGWPKGIYVVKVTIDKEVLTEKIIMK